MRTFTRRCTPALLTTIVIPLAACTTVSAPIKMEGRSSVTSIQAQLISNPNSYELPIAFDLAGTPGSQTCESTARLVNLPLFRVKTYDPGAGAATYGVYAGFWEEKIYFTAPATDPFNISLASPVLGGPFCQGRSSLKSSNEQSLQVVECTVPPKPTTVATIAAELSIEYRGPGSLVNCDTTNPHIIIRD